MLHQERNASALPTREMTYFLDEGKENTEMKERIYQIIERDKELVSKQFYDIDTIANKERCMRQIRRFVEYRKEYMKSRDGEAMIQCLLQVLGTYDRSSFAMRAYVHETVFREAILVHGTSEQWKRYQPHIDNYTIIGSFAMTELGHGSFLRGIETTAIYDRDSQEFIINTPTLTATKVTRQLVPADLTYHWLRNVVVDLYGWTSTHTVAVCKLIIDGKEYGLQYFIIPLRDKETGRLLPGVAAGDLGEKMGRNGADNGYIQFTNVRVPRDNMLQKWCKVSPNGEFSGKISPTIAYASLFGERIAVGLGMSIDSVTQALAITVRYSAVRIQGANDEKIIDYQSHQYNLMPMIASSYAYLIIHRHLKNLWEAAKPLLNNEKTQSEFLKIVPDLHAVVSGLKAWCSWWGVDSLEICRRCLGGHGYSAYNAIPGLLADFGPQTTGGGDNIVLVQQTARYLLSSWKISQSDKRNSLIGTSVEYLNHAKDILNKVCFATRAEDWLRSEVYLDAFQWLSVVVIRHAASLFNTNNSNSAWNDNMMTLVDCCKAYSHFYLVKHFTLAVEASTLKYPILTTTLKKLSTLFALQNITSLSSLFLEHGYFSGTVLQLIKKEVLRLCKDIRRDAVPLVDAFNYPDWILKAPIGRYDGDVYSHYFDIVKNSHTNTSTNDPVYYWKEFVSPLVNAKL